MSKHRRKRNPDNNVRNNNSPNNNNNNGQATNNGSTNRQQFNNNPFGINPNQLLSMLGNIDMGQIGSLLQNMSVPGLDFNNMDLGPLQSMMGNMGGQQQSNTQNNQQTRNNMEHSREKENANIKSNTDISNNDDNMQMLRAIRSIVDGGRAEFIDKIINLYNDGAFDEK